MNDGQKLTLNNLGFDTPGGRTHENGMQSGERFRKEHLQGAVEAGGKIVIDLDGSTGGTSSFYDESIGWLIREGVLSREEARARIQVVTTERELRYIRGLVSLVIHEA